MPVARIGRDAFLPVVHSRHDCPPGNRTAAGCHDTEAQESRQTENSAVALSPDGLSVVATVTV